MKVTVHNGLIIYTLSDHGPLLGVELAATDLIGDAYNDNPNVIAVPVDRISDGFLDLQTGIAGEVFQKMEQYGQRLAVIGDIELELARSKALRDFVFETNRRGHHLFAASEDVMLSMLG